MDVTATRAVKKRFGQSIPDAADAKKGRSRLVLALLTVVGRFRGKNEQKNRVLVPSDEGRVRKSTRRWTMFAMGHALLAK